MHVYKDRNGNDRTIDIDVSSVERCQSSLGVNLYDLQALGNLASDTLGFLRLVHCVSAPSETFDDWWQAHTGDAGNAAVETFTEALCDLLPSRLATMLRQVNAAVKRETEHALSELEAEFAAV